MWYSKQNLTRNYALISFQNFLYAFSRVCYWHSLQSCEWICPYNLQSKQRVFYQCSSQKLLRCLCLGQLHLPTNRYTQHLFFNLIGWFRLLWHIQKLICRDQLPCLWYNHSSWWLWTHQPSSTWPLSLSWFLLFFS